MFSATAFLSCKSPGNEKSTEATEKASVASPALADNDAFKDSLDGKQVNIFYLENNGIEAGITNYGGRVVNLLVPDKQGNKVDVIVGPSNLKDMHDIVDFYGAIIGRYGNRIANGKFSLNGTEYSLNVNNGKNTLHGGKKGFHNQVWDAEQTNDSTLVLTYTSADGEQGFPGTLKAKVVYTLTASKELKIDYEATTDKTTVCNLTNHSYFNLNGGGTINNHLLQINANSYTPVDATLIPTGELQDVAGTPFDFRNPTAIGARVDEKNTQLEYGKGYDHNFVVGGDGSAMRTVARITGDQSGISMEVISVEPGLQFYGGNFMDSKFNMKYGTKNDYRTAFCLETQHYPDSPNQPAFPSTTLEPGSVYKTATIYKFSAQ
ncbi:galactose mutarotase [Niabella terrae]